MVAVATGFVAVSIVGAGLAAVGFAGSLGSAATVSVDVVVAVGMASGVLALASTPRPDLGAVAINTTIRMMTTPTPIGISRRSRAEAAARGSEEPLELPMNSASFA